MTHGDRTGLTAGTTDEPSDEPTSAHADVDPADLAVGDTFSLADGSELVVTGRTDHDVEGTLYEVQIRAAAPDADDKTCLYGPHHFAGLVDDAEYVGQEDGVGRSDPFVCAGCGYAWLAEQEHEALLLSESVCSYGCGRDVHAEKRKQKMDERTEDGR